MSDFDSRSDVHERRRERLLPVPSQVSRSVRCLLYNAKYLMVPTRQPILIGDPSGSDGTC